MILTILHLARVMKYYMYVNVLKIKILKEALRITEKTHKISKGQW